MKIYIICSVRGVPREYKDRILAHAAALHKKGHEVRVPWDTAQDGTGINICCSHREDCQWADEIHVFYKADSQGSHFDLGMAFMARKPLVVVENADYGPGKSFPRMIEEWQASAPPKGEA